MSTQRELKAMTGTVSADIRLPDDHPLVIKNRELLAANADLRKQVEDLTVRAEKVEADYNSLTFEQPINDFFAKTFTGVEPEITRMIFERDYSYKKDDGFIYVTDKKGDFLLDSKGEKVPLDYSGELREIISNCNALYAFAPKATGTGALGSGKKYSPQHRVDSNKDYSSQFGLK